MPLLSQKKIANNRYYFIKVSQNSASVYQDENGKHYNFDVKKAAESIAEEKSSNDINSDWFYTSFFYAANLFSARVAQSRKLVIVSCGNCVRYNPLHALKFSYYMNKLNVQVSSFGNYNMVDQDAGEDATDKPAGYGQENIFLYNGDEKTVETDDIKSYKIKHRSDMCQRLASRTNGNTFDLAYINKPGVFAQVMKKLAEVSPKYEQTAKQCVRHETPLGDFEDFAYERRAIQ
jgi:hypothetical protein